MIRERRDEDLDRLGQILQALGHPSSGWSAAALRGWLTEHRAEQSWVFDQAPVTVAPTKNVVSHLEIYRPDPAVSSLLGERQRPGEELLAVGKLFVRPQAHEYGIARYLLKEAVRHIRSQDKLPVAILEENAVPLAFFEKFGFEQMPSAGADATLLVHTAPA